MDNTNPSSIQQKYFKRLLKRIAGKPPEIRLLMHRTFSTATWILEDIADIPFPKLTMDTYFFCRDIETQSFVRLYDAQIELAGANPERFIFSLHSFYTDISAKIRNAGKAQEFAEFLGSVMRLQYEKTVSADPKIICAYLKLLLQTGEYLRPNKLDFSKDICGYSLLDGSFLVSPTPFPYADLPDFELKCETKGEIFSYNHGEVYGRLFASYKRHGINIRSLHDIDWVNQVQRLHENMVSTMLPFITEYTFDIVPKKAYSNTVPPLGNIRIKTDYHELEPHLQHRRRTLPSNGATFQLRTEKAPLCSILLMETLCKDAIHCLYRLETPEGDLSGYYNTKDGFFYSAALSGQDLDTHEKIRSLILLLYASQVIDASIAPDLNQVFQSGRYPVFVQVFGKGGKPRDTYHTDEKSAGKQRDRSLYDTKEVNISGFIRKLPAGATASEEAKAQAEALGYSLADDETYVRPFVKEVFVRREST